MGNFRKSLLPVFTFAKIDIRRLFRDKVALFFTFAFPLIFLFIFGGIFGSNNGVSFNVGLVNQSQSEFSRDFIETLKKNKVLKVDAEVTNLDQAREKMNRSEVDGTIILPENFGQTGDKAFPNGEARVLYDQNSEQAGQALASILEATFKDINSDLVPTETPFTVKAESTATQGLTPFDYTFSGLLGFAVISLGIFGPATVFPKLKSRGVLRRYRTTTLKVWQYFLGNVLSTAFVGILSVALMFVVALTVFDLNMRGDYASFAIIVVLGTVVLFGMGLAVGGWAQNEKQAAPLANLLTFPMLFLSGTFFPRFLMPEWLQAVSAFIPLTPVIDGVRLIITEGRTIFDLGPQVALLVGWAIIIYAIAFKVFRWE
ncbi:MAG: ABC transporter permease [Candidatus Saccharimonadales bacterium]